MTDLCILRCTGDAEFMKVARADNAFTLATQLTEGHPFDIHVVAVYPGSGHLLDGMQPNLRGHVKNGWYRMGLLNLLASLAGHIAASLTTVLEACPETKAGEEAVAMSDEELEGDGALSVESHSRIECEPELFAYVEVCSKLEADRATVIKKSLVKKHGKAQATLLLASLNEAVSKTGSSKQRIYMYQGKPLRLKSTM